MNHSQGLNVRPQFSVWLVQGLRASVPVLGRFVANLHLSLRRYGGGLAAWWQRQAWPTRLYSGGGIVMVASLASMLIGISFREIPQILFIEGTFLLAAGIVHEGYQVARWILATALGKLTTTLIATMIVALAMAISSVIVNDTIGFSPSDFPYTVSFLAPLTAGYIALVSIFAIFVVALLAIVGLGMFSIGKALCVRGFKVEGESAKMFTRLIAAITLLTLTIHAWNEQHGSYESGLSTTASWFAYNFEMYGKDPCARGKYERVRRIEPGQALIGSERNGQRAFFVRRCSPSIFL